ncbi:hypothetical protein CEXT_368871 [Caerostris extrusa]|uniref:Uncharacterized protein n=1 Tax=Caerostris extrusa TaxID=172846 RepID=A0AAV4PEZ1_CAEEX|nr:hypothetical protein CEXT_368871 [Caerostris extrusa]
MIHLLYSNNSNNNISPTKSHRRKAPLQKKEMGKSMLLRSLFQETIGMGGRGEKTEIKPSTYQFVFLKHSVNIISPINLPSRT